MGYNDCATYGLDTVALAFSDAIGGPCLDSQVVAAFETDEYYLGLFGLGHEGLNFSDYSTPNATFLRTLKELNMIPSLSWGYTAGAVYQSKEAFGSLTLGGYDTSRLVPNKVSFSLATDISQDISLASDNPRDLTVSLNSITTRNANDCVVSLLSEPIWTFIDSKIPNIYLPSDVCEAFEKTFGLVWNTTYQRYLVDDDQHEILIAENNNITFGLGTNETIEILLPYSSFDLVMEYPLIPSNLSGIRYFPLKRAADPSQYTLGRAFLQEAYIITNYERSTFSVFQSRFEDGVKPNIVAISLASTESHTSRNIKIGVSLGVIAFFLLSLIATIFFVKKKRRRPYQSGEREHETMKAMEPRKHSVQEIASNSLYRELPDSGKAELLDSATPSGSGNQVLELSGPAEPVPYEVVDPSLPAVHELMPHRTSDERPMVQNHASRSKHAIFVSTNMSRQSRPGIGTSTDSPRVETTICSQKPETINVDRSLPPTPISESPQVSPVVINFRGAVTSRKGPDAFVERSAAVESMCGTMGQVPSSPPNHLNDWQRRFTHLSYASMDMEIVGPPGPAEVDIIKPLNVYKKSENRRGNFF